MKAYLATLICLCALARTQGVRWTRWYDRDNPSGTGDWETLADQEKLGPVCAGGAKPTSARCRVKGESTVFYQNGGSPPDKLAVKCDPKVGLVCKNNDQPDGRCSDYEISYACENWSQWYDRDNPSGTGDWENLSEQQKLGAVCGGMTPSNAECRVKGSSTTFTATSGSPPDKLHMRCTTAGLICRNSDQPRGRFCRDYEIRYDCPSLLVKPLPLPGRLPIFSRGGAMQ